MGLYNREYMRDDNDVARPPRERSRRRQLITLVILIVAGLFLLQLLSRFLFPDNWAAVARVLALEEVGWAGIGWDGVLPAEQAAMNVPCALRVTEVAPHGPADRAGLRINDYIVGLEGQPFSSVLELQGKASAFRPGQTITLDVIRDGEPLAIEITLTTWAEIERLDILGGIGL